MGWWHTGIRNRAQGVAQTWSDEPCIILTLAHFTVAYLGLPLYLVVFVVCFKFYLGVKWEGTLAEAAAEPKLGLMLLASS